MSTALRKAICTGRNVAKYYTKKINFFVNLLRKTRAEYSQKLNSKRYLRQQKKKTKKTGKQ